MKRSSRIGTPVIGSLVVAALIVVLAAPVAQGLSLTCTGSKAHLIIILRDLATTLFAETLGSITMEVGELTQSSDGTLQRSVRVLDVNSSGQAQNVGAVSFTADTSRKAGPSGIVSLQSGEEFPAQQTVRFHFTAEIEGAGTFRSINPAEISGTIDSLPPQPGTTYELTNRVRLEDPAWPGETVAVIEPGHVFTIESTQ